MTTLKSILTMTLAVCASLVPMLANASTPSGCRTLLQERYYGNKEFSVFLGIDTAAPSQLVPHGAGYGGKPATDPKMPMEYDVLGELDISDAKTGRDLCPLGTKIHIKMSITDWAKEIAGDPSQCRVVSESFGPCAAAMKKYLESLGEDNQ